MPLEPRPLPAQPMARTIRCLFVVTQDQPDLWHRLRRDFREDPGIQVVLDRRKGERRQRAQTHEREQRRIDRRRHASVDNELRYRSFVIIHEQQGVLSG